MKRLNAILTLVCAFFFSISAADLTPAQDKAQLALFQYLEKENYQPKIDNSDNSVCFRKNGVFFWVTFEENSPILYSLHRKAFKVGNEQGDYDRKLSMIAANEVNRLHKSIKLYVGEKRVEIVAQVYAAKPEDFIKVFLKYLALFDNVDIDFKTAYQKALDAERENANRIEEEMRKNLPPSELKGKIENVSFRLLDASDEVVTPYDEPLRSFKARFVQPRIEFLPWKEKPEDFTIQIRLTKPNGQPLNLPGKKFSAEKTVTIEKSKKNQLIEFDKFGSDKEGFWKAGEYKVEVLEGGDIIYTTTFNML